MNQSKEVYDNHLILIAIDNVRRELPHLSTDSSIKIADTMSRLATLYSLLNVKLLKTLTKDAL